jgi:hypothetical protein
MHNFPMSDPPSISQLVTTRVGGHADPAPEIEHPLGNGWATQHPATAANASPPQAEKLAFWSEMREQP